MLGFDVPNRQKVAPDGCVGLALVHLGFVEGVDFVCAA
jgi:hypothetical protein